MIMNRRLNYDVMTSFIIVHKLNQTRPAIGTRQPAAYLVAFDCYLWGQL